MGRCNHFDSIWVPRFGVFQCSLSTNSDEISLLLLLKSILSVLQEFVPTVFYGPLCVLWYSCFDWLWWSLLMLCLWSATARKNLNLLRCIHVLGLTLNCCADIDDRVFDLILFFLPLIAAMVVNFVLNFFHMWGLMLEFSHILVLRKCMQLNSQTETSALGKFLIFVKKKRIVSSTSDLHGLKFTKIAQLCFLSVEIKSFRYLVWEVIRSFFNCAHSFQPQVF